MRPNPVLGVEERIRQCLATFVAEIAELAGERAMEICSASFGGAGGGGRRRTGSARDGGAARGNRRSPEEIARTSRALLDAIQASPGLRVEQLGRTLGAPTKDLSLPLQRLLARKVIRTEGERRATRYFAAVKRGGGRVRTG